MTDDRVPSDLNRQTDAVAELLLAGDHRAAERALDTLRDVAWRHRAATVRAGRHAGPAARAEARLVGTVLGAGRG